jgi:hypothetical protein
MLKVQVPSDRMDGPGKSENEASRNKMLRLAGSVYCPASRCDAPACLAAT